MRRRSSKLRLVPIDSTKNIVQYNAVVAPATVVEVVIAATAQPKDVDEVDTTKTFYVEEGAMIRGFANTIRVYNESGVQDSNSTIIYCVKYENTNVVLPAVPAPPAIANINSLGTWSKKNRVFHVEQAITGSQVSGLPMGFPNIKIPKRFHAMKRGDYWMIGVANNTAQNLRFCGLTMYKWYR